MGTLEVEPQGFLQIKADFLSLKKELSEVSYQLVSLYDRWSVEHQHVARREADMARLIESFDGEIKRLSALDKQFQNNIQATTTKAAILVGDTMAKEARELFESRFGSAAEKLDRTIHNAESAAYRFEQMQESASLKVWAIVVISCLSIGFIAGILTDSFKERPLVRCLR